MSRCTSCGSWAGSGHRFIGYDLKEAHRDVLCDACANAFHRDIARIHQLNRWYHRVTFWWQAGWDGWEVIYDSFNEWHRWQWVSRFRLDDDGRGLEAEFRKAVLQQAAHGAGYPSFTLEIARYAFDNRMGAVYDPGHPTER